MLEELVSAIIAIAVIVSVVRAAKRPVGMEIIYTQDRLPSWWRGGPRIFLAGPTWRPVEHGLCQVWQENNHTNDPGHECGKPAVGLTLDRVLVCSSCQDDDTLAPYFSFPAELRTSWRFEVIRELHRMGFEGFVFVPEFEDGKWASHKYDWETHNYHRLPLWGRKREVSWGEQVVSWEHAALSKATIRLFWMPFTLPVAHNPEDTQLGFTTRLELGWWLAKAPRSVVCAFPPKADTKAFIRYHGKLGGAHMLFNTTIARAVHAVLEILDLRRQP